MSKDFLEPWLLANENNLETILKRLVFLDFKGAIFENVSSNTLQNFKIFTHKKEEFLIFNRRTLDSSKKNPSELDKIRNDFDFVCFFCSNADITKWACQDQRVDCLTFNLSDIHQLVDDSTINLAKSQDKAIEIDFSEILHKKNPIPFLRNIKKVMYKATRKNLPVIFSSRAKNEFDLRSSYSLMGFLEFIDVEYDYYERISQKWLFERLVRNKKRKKEIFVSPGVWLKDNEEDFK